MQHAATPEELASLAGVIEAWLAEQLEDNPVVAAAESDPDAPGRWFIRVQGEDKDVFSIWLHLRQRTLHYETFLMPAPDENHAEFYAFALRRNSQLVGAAFSIGEEDAIFLEGSIGIDAVSPDELDRVLGSLYVWTEQYFKAMLRIGFASRMANK